MADEIIVNEAPPEDEPETPAIVVAPVIVTGGESDNGPEYVSRAEFDAYVAEHSETGHGDLRTAIGALAGIEALLVEDELAEQAVEEIPATETVIEDEPAAGDGDEEPASGGGERHAGVWI